MGSAGMQRFGRRTHRTQRRWRPHGTRAAAVATALLLAGATAGLGAWGQPAPIEATTTAPGSSAPPTAGSATTRPPGTAPTASDEAPPVAGSTSAPPAASRPPTAPGFPPPYGAAGPTYPSPPYAGPPPPPPGYGYGYEDPAALPPPSELPYEDGQPIPAGYQRSSRIQKGLVIAGAVTFGTLYIISAGVAAAYLDDESQDAPEPPPQDDEEPTDAEAYAPLFVPVAGPFVALATVEPSATGTMALILDGVGQSAGLAMLIAGLVVRTDVLVRNEPAGLSLTVAPTLVGEGTTGLGLVGAF